MGFSMLGRIPTVRERRVRKADIMVADDRLAFLQGLPSMTELLKRPEVQRWRRAHPAAVVTECLRAAVGEARENTLRVGASPVDVDAMLLRAEALLVRATTPAVRHAINATGIILHTGLGRAVFPEAVVDSIGLALKGYCTLATDPVSGERIERDELVEPILCELTGAEAATVVNNNAAATLLVLAALRPAAR
jgi:L-seryl-tRNA(Ser) seleniumtransferase